MTEIFAERNEKRIAAIFLPVLRDLFFESRKCDEKGYRDEQQQDPDDLKEGYCIVGDGQANHRSKPLSINYIHDDIKYSDST